MYYRKGTDQHLTFLVSCFCVSLEVIFSGLIYFGVEVLLGLELFLSSLLRNKNSTEICCARVTAVINTCN